MPPSPEPPSVDHVVTLLARSQDGDDDAAAEVYTLVHDELRGLARHHMRGQSPGHTLQTTALVNEAYLRLVGQDVDWRSRGQFFDLAARAMRSVLVDHARARSAAKRGGGWARAPLSGIVAMTDDGAGELLAVDDALRELSTFDERRGRIVELRVFGGLEVEHVARVLDVSTATVKREWRLARAWLRRQLEEESDGGS